ncbi:hypothetical protein JCM14076_10920 [Methylosoma difficile]
MSIPLLLTLVIFLAAIHWNKAEKIKEIAIKATRDHCHAMQVLMLDDYIAFKCFSFKRGRNGKRQLRRDYSFEFTSTGDDRYNGRITMLGARVDSIYMEPYRINTD